MKSSGIGVQGSGIRGCLESTGLCVSGFRVEGFQIRV